MAKSLNNYRLLKNSYRQSHHLAKGPRLPFWLTVSLLLHGGILLLDFPTEPRPSLPPPMEISFRARPSASPAAPTVSSTQPKFKPPAPAQPPSLPARPAVRKEVKTAEPRSAPEPERSPPGPQPFSAKEMPIGAEEVPNAPSVLGDTLTSDLQKTDEIATFTPPVRIFGDDPEYPQSFIRRGWQGTVVLRVLVGIEGRVEEIRVEESSGYELLDRNALTAVRGWRFQPARSGNRALAEEVLQKIIFAPPDR